MSGLTDQIWFDPIVKLASRVHFPEGETFHFAGQPFTKLSLIVSGQIEIWNIGQGGKEVWLGTIKAGDVIGTSSLFSEQLTNFHWVALTNLTLLNISPKSFSILSETYPDLAIHLSERLSHILDQTREAFVLSQTKTAKGRIEHELFRLSERVGIAPDKRVIRPSPVFSDMARRANTTRETVSRTVSELCRTGILERQPGALVLNAPERLRREIK